jgi:uncharacterized pyridoxal phosphate-containing UPF0001 family protein
LFLTEKASSWVMSMRIPRSLRLAAADYDDDSNSKCAPHRRSRARQAGRAREQRHLLAVSKTFRPRCRARGTRRRQRAFGENYVQEALAKMAALAGLRQPEWHLIGPLQSNKTRLVARHFDWVHSVDRLKIAQSA